MTERGYEYLKSQEWKTIKNRVHKRDYYQCFFCGEKSDLNAHHLTYRNHYNEQDEELITLCHSCHWKMHTLLEKMWDFGELVNDPREASSKNEEETETTSSNNGIIKLNAEIRTILAVIIDLELTSYLFSETELNDYEDPLARQLYQVLLDCEKEGNISIPAILNRCPDEEVQRMITKVITSKEFSGDNNKNYFRESIKMIKHNSLERKRKELMNNIHKFKPVTPDDQKTLALLITQKMEIDKLLQDDEKEDLNEVFFLDEL